MKRVCCVGLILADMQYITALEGVKKKSLTVSFYQQVKPQYIMSEKVYQSLITISKHYCYEECCHHQGCKEIHESLT